MFTILHHGIGKPAAAKLTALVASRGVVTEPVPSNSPSLTVSPTRSCWGGNPRRIEGEAAHISVFPGWVRGCGWWFCVQLATGQQRRTGR